MQRIAIIGCGAIAEAVAGYLADQDEVTIGVAIVNQGRESRAREVFGDDVEVVTNVNDMDSRVAIAADCAGHAALRQHGAAILSSGIDLITVSSGALANDALCDGLSVAAARGGAQLRVVAWAIGALDALAAGKVGDLASVTYRGRKPPQGWRGSPAESKLDLDGLAEPAVHFSGSARSAALEYPKNANVAASVALAGIGLDDTIVELIADPAATRNTHEIVAEGEFGRFEFCIEGNALPNNPRSSALTAMSVANEILKRATPIVI